MAGISWLASKLFTVSSIRAISFQGCLAFYGQEKKHSFHGRKVERRDALSIREAKRSPKGRGSEHGAHLVFMPRGAAQAGLTEEPNGALNLRHETNVEWPKDRPKAAPRIWVGGRTLANCGCGAWNPHLDNCVTPRVDI